MSKRTSEMQDKIYQNREKLAELKGKATPRITTKHLDEVFARMEEIIAESYELGYLAGLEEKKHGE